MRQIGHRDLLRTVERLFRRAGLRLGMSQGFHPKPRMSFPLALALGIEGFDEVMELELAESYTAEQLRRRLAEHALPGLKFHSVEILHPGAGKARVQSVTYQVPIPAKHRTETADRAARLMAAASCPVQRPDKPAPIDLRPLLEDLALREGVLRMRLQVGREASARPRDVLGALGLADLEQSGVHLRRTTVTLQ